MIMMFMPEISGIWLVGQTIDLNYVHVVGRNNRGAHLLFRWSVSLKDMAELYKLVVNPIWIKSDLHMLEMNYTL